MAHRTSKLAIAAFLAMLSSGAVQAQNYDYLDRSDGISISASDAPQANITIQSPTPWPSYVNNTTIHSSGDLGLSAMEKLLKHYKDTGEEPAGTPQTVINLGQPPTQ